MGWLAGIAPMNQSLAFSLKSVRSEASLLSTWPESCSSDKDPAAPCTHTFKCVRQHATERVILLHLLAVHKTGRNALELLAKQILRFKYTPCTYNCVLYPELQQKATTVILHCMFDLSFVLIPGWATVSGMNPNHLSDFSTWQKRASSVNIYTGQWIF